MPLGYGKLFARTRRQLGLRVGARAGAERPARLHAARQGARRLLVDQRPGLHPRPARRTTTAGSIPGWDFATLAALLREGGAAAQGVRPRAPRAVRRLHRRRAASLGIPRNDDFNGAQQEGTGYYRATTHQGPPLAAPRPLICATGGEARERVTVGSMRSLNQRFSSKANEPSAWNATASRFTRLRVILCAECVQFPQLLQLSGVGPRALLESHGIPVVHDSPLVGEDLQDHFYARTFWRCRRSRSR